MQYNISPRHVIVRMRDVPAAFSESVGRFYEGASGGVRPRPIKLGARAAGITAYEIAEVQAARVRGATAEELRAIVDRLHAERAGSVQRED